MDTLKYSEILYRYKFIDRQVGSFSTMKTSETSFHIIKFSYIIFWKTLNTR